MKTPDANAQVAALLELLPDADGNASITLPDHPIVVGIDSAFGPSTSAQYVVTPDGIVPVESEEEARLLLAQINRQEEDRLRPIVHEPRDVSFLRQRSITAHTVALLSVLGSLGDATLGRRTFDVPPDDGLPRHRRPNRVDVFGRDRDPPQTAHTQSQSDRDAIEKAEAKRARRALRKR